MDSLLNKFLAITYPNVWKIAVMVFTISHGQAQIGRDFNTNKEMLGNHIGEKTLTAKIMVYDELRHHGQGGHEFPISKELRKSCRGAKMKYLAYLDEAKKVELAATTSRKRKLIQDELNEVKRRKKEVGGVLDEVNAN